MKSRARASGEPVNRSPITATEAAPLAITSGARSSVIPPIATTGKPAASASARGLAYDLQADGFVAGRLRARAKHGTDRKIGNWRRDRRLPLRPGMRRQAEQRRRAKDLPRVSRREILLPDVQSVRAGDGGDIRAIVHDHGAAGTIRFVNDGPGQVEKRTAVPALDAKLDAPDPGRQERTRDVERRAAGAGARLCVDDRVEPGQMQLRQIQRGPWSWAWRQSVP